MSSPSSPLHELIHPPSGYRLNRIHASILPYLGLHSSRTALTISALGTRLWVLVYVNFVDRLPTAPRLDADGACYHPRFACSTVVIDSNRNGDVAIWDTVRVDTMEKCSIKITTILSFSVVQTITITSPKTECRDPSRHIAVQSRHLNGGQSCSRT